VSTKYVTNALIALLGGLMVVFSMAVSAHVAGWIAFGVSIGLVALSALAQLDVSRGLVQRLVDLGVVATAGTLIGASVFFTGTTLTWLVFALALGVTGLAFTGLTIHEIQSWRAMHGLGELHWLHERRARREVPTGGQRVA
jgi:hypothetical protein